VGRAGVASRGPSGVEVTGSAAQLGEPPLDRALYELCERAAVVEGMEPATTPLRHARDSEAAFPSSPAPERWVHSRSNGVAFHTDLDEARRRALWELVERDRVLRAWYGELVPARTELPGHLPLMQVCSQYALEAYLLPSRDPAGHCADVRVAAVLGFPRGASLPLLIGFAARPRAGEALEAAASEALQRLAFVWGEPLPEAAPVVAPSPHTHLDWFLHPPHHRLLREWLAGAHARYGADWQGTPFSGPVTYLDLTPPWLRGSGWVVKAQCPGAVPLTFGCGPDRLAGHLPDHLRVHPIA
jgi:hypothetical protein